MGKKQIQMIVRTKISTIRQTKMYYKKKKKQHRSNAAFICSFRISKSNTKALRKRVLFLTQKLSEIPQLHSI